MSAEADLIHSITDMRTAFPYVCALPFIFVACSSSSAPTAREPLPLPSFNAHHSSAGERARNSRYDFSFGTVLAHDQVLRHTFTLSNKSRHAIKLGSVHLSHACCTKIETLPSIIPVAAERKVTVSFRPSHRAGEKRVEIAIETDSPECPLFTLVLTARVLPEWEVVLGDDFPRSTFIGEVANGVCQIVCRHQASEGLTLPEKIVTLAPLEADFKGPAAETTQPPDILQLTRDVQIFLPAIPKSGLQTGDVLFQWADGTSRRITLSWEVRPHITLAPSAVTAHRSDAPIAHRITLESCDKPFKITHISGPLLIKPIALSLQPSNHFTLPLMLDTSHALPEKSYDIEIGTNHPAHRTLTLSVLVLASE